MQFPRRGRPAPLAVLDDPSLDGGIEQVLALAMLFGFAALQQIRIPRSRTQIDTKGGSVRSERARTESESFNSYSTKCDRALTDMYIIWLAGQGVAGSNPVGRVANGMVALDLPFANRHSDNIPSIISLLILQFRI